MSNYCDLSAFCVFENPTVSIYAYEFSNTQFCHLLDSLTDLLLTVGGQSVYINQTKCSFPSGGGGPSKMVDEGNFYLISQLFV